MICAYFVDPMKRLISIDPYWRHCWHWCWPLLKTMTLRFLLQASSQGDLAATESR
jgi:hypothetical protein